MIDRCPCRLRWVEQCNDIGEPCGLDTPQFAIDHEIATVSEHRDARSTLDPGGRARRGFGEHRCDEYAAPDRIAERELETPERRLLTDAWRWHATTFKCFVAMAL